MNTEKIIKNTRTMMFTAFALFGLLLIVGLSIGRIDPGFLTYRKGIIGLSFIPLAVGVAALFKLNLVRNDPARIKDIIIQENDERLVNLKHEAESKAFRIVQAAIFMSYMAYTLLVPDDIFEAVGWWILLGLLFITFASQGYLMYQVQKGDQTEEE